MPATKYVFKQRTYGCETCGLTEKRLDWDYDAPPTHCNVQMTPVYDTVNVATAVIGDDIPGGVLIHHGACNEDGSPRRFYSKRAIKEAARAKGWAHEGDTPLAPRGGWQE